MSPLPSEVGISVSWKPDSLAEMTEWYVATVHDFFADSILVCKTVMEISYTPLAAEELDIQCTEVQSCMARFYIYILPHGWKIIVATLFYEFWHWDYTANEWELAGLNLVLVQCMAESLVLILFNYPTWLAIYCKHNTQCGVPFWVKFLSQWPMDKQWSESVDSSVHETGTQVQLTLILQVSYLFSGNYVGVAKEKF